LEIRDRDTTVIVRGAIDGDESSYKALYAKYATAMYNICLRLLNNKEDAEDVLQESFITAFKRLGELREASTFGGWLRRIVVNNCHEHGRKTKISFEEMGASDGIVEDDLNWIHDVPASEVHFAIRNLPDGCRKVFLLYTSEDYTHRDIAKLLNIAESTSKSQYGRAKKLLQLQLKKRYG
jgi:RNA polymerase sigma-70 factor (ECF subfamily)